MVGLLESFQDFYGGGLAGPVLAQEAKNLPPTQHETDVTYRYELAKPLRNAADFNDVRHAGAHHNEHPIDDKLGKM